VTKSIRSPILVFSHGNAVIDCGPLVLIGSYRSSPFVAPYCPRTSTLAPNLLFPACAATRPRVDGVSDRSAGDRANIAAENPR
jgi:hypothetical protein